MHDRDSVINDLNVAKLILCNPQMLTPEMCVRIGQVVTSAINLLKEQEVKIEHLKRPDCKHAEHDGIGCLGYAGCIQDDEPIDACKECEKYTGNVFEAVKLND